MFDQSVNIPKFKQYVDQLREENGNDKICLFMDNLSAHTSHKSQKNMTDNGFRFIYNLAYEPDFNPIESVFSKVKRRFKTLRG